MQEDVRLFCLPLWSAVEECVCVCVCLCMFLVCTCERACACVHTVGVCGWLFVLNGHLYSSFMSTAAILRDRVVYVSVSVS